MRFDNPGIKDDFEVHPIDREEMMGILGRVFPAWEILDVSPRKDGGVVAFYKNKEART